MVSAFATAMAGCGAVALTLIYLPVSLWLTFFGKLPPLEVLERIARARARKPRIRKRTRGGVTVQGADPAKPAAAASASAARSRSEL